jgi:hypothetical protein
MDTKTKLVTPPITLVPADQPVRVDRALVRQGPKELVQVAPLQMPETINDPWIASKVVDCESSAHSESQKLFSDVRFIRRKRQEAGRLRSRYNSHELARQLRERMGVPAQVELNEVQYRSDGVSLLLSGQTYFLCENYEDTRVELPSAVYSLLGQVLQSKFPITGVFVARALTDNAVKSLFEKDRLDEDERLRLESVRFKDQIAQLQEELRINEDRRKRNQERVSKFSDFFAPDPLLLVRVGDGEYYVRVARWE